MRKVFTTVFLALLSVAAFAQSPTFGGSSGGGVTVFNGAPTGGCSSDMVAVNSTNGDLYDCVSGTWVKTGPNSGVFTLRGSWSGSTSYSALDVVAFQGATYSALVANTNITPGTDGTKWQLIAAAGQTGATGAQGPQGNSITGPQGAAGTNGFTSLLKFTAESAGANCTNGGTKVQVGIDTDRSGVLDANEVTATQYVCKGDKGDTGAQGIQGVTGPQGTGFTFRNAWDGTTSYVVNDVVTLSGSTYVAVGNSVNVLPGTDGTKWALWARQGDVGATGSTGTSGVAHGTTPINYDSGTQTVSCPNCAQKSDVQAGQTMYGDDIGAADAYQVTLSPVPASLTRGQIIVFQAAHANTTSTPTLNVNQLGGITITKKQGTAALAAGDIAAHGMIVVVYDDIDNVFQMISPTAN